MKKKKIKVLYLNYFQSRGGAAIAMNRILASLKRRVYIRKICYQIDDPVDQQLFYIPNNLDLFLRIIKYKFQHFLKFFLNSNHGSHSFNIFSSKFLKLINNSNFDLVHFHWIGNEMISIEDIGKINKPIIWTTHDMWPFCGSSHYSFLENFDIFKSSNNLDSYTFFRKKKNWHNIGHVVAPSHWQFKNIKKSKLFKNKKNFLIKYPINTKIWKPFPKNLSRKKIGIGLNELVFLFASDNRALDKRKGLAQLIKVLNALSKRINFRLIIMGSSYKDLINFEKLNFACTIFSHISDIEKNPPIYIYSASDLFLFPSVSEVGGLVVQEAAACGIPVIAFEDTGAASFVSHKKTGYLAKNKNFKNFYRGIKWVIKNKNALKKENIINYVKNNFSYKIISNKYLEVYKNITKSNI